MSLRWPASTRSSSAGSGSVMASGRPRTRSAGQPLHPTAGHGVHPGDTIAVSYDVSRTELWTGTCTGDDHTGLRITWEPPTPRRQHDRPLTADDLANATVVRTAEQAAAAQAQPAVCDYEQQRNAAVARNQAFLGQLSLPAGTGFGSIIGTAKPLSMFANLRSC
eukprot:COSAG03_NODE_936_length_5265_cov_20.249322_3_plen_164_part_00